MSVPGEIYCCLATLDFAGTLAQRHVQGLMQLCLNMTVLPSRLGEIFSAEIS